MITINITQSDRGKRLDFADEPSALVWLQDEIERWRSLIQGKVTEGAMTIPLVNWIEVKEEIDGLRRRRARTNESADYEYKDSMDQLVTYESVVGRSLSFVLK
jgi:hypothetical protein